MSTTKPETPRYLHKPGVDSLLVKDEAAYDAAIADGWSVSNQFDAIEPVAEPPADDEPKKRGRKPKAD